jgi:uncharacterized NAD(P)/FAD-binding protein YdhS
MPIQTVRDVVIIGGGASATLLAWNLSRNHQRKCTVVASADRPAFGLAYSTPSLRNLLNVAAGDISADPDNPHHFLEWMRENITTATKPDTFVPRPIFGLYLRELFCAAAPEHVRDNAIRCHKESRAYKITLAGGATIKARQIVLALGNFDPARVPGIPIELDGTGRYHHNAWADGVFGGIGINEEVVLIGTGLTTVDVVIRLRENGHRGRVTAVSRRALLPERHAVYSMLPTPVILPGVTSATARAYLRVFHAALRRGTDWRAAVDSIRPVLNNLWLALPEVEKFRFRRHLQRRWDVHRHRMPPQIADVIDAERQAGSLCILDGYVSKVVPVGEMLRVKARSARRYFHLDAGHVINCTGPSLNYRAAASPLLRAMLDAGDIVPGFAGAGLHCTLAGAVINRAGYAASDLFAIGPPRLGVLFESIAIREIREQARDLATLLANRLLEVRDAAE